MTITLRRWRMEDIPFIVQECARELPALPNYKGVEVNELHLRYMLESNLNNDAHICAWVLVDESGEIVGGSAGYCTKLLFADALYTGDIFLYIGERHRSLVNAVRLIDAYKQWAIARGAAIISVTHTSGYRTEQMDKLLKRQGFEAVGTIYHLRRD